MCMWMTESECCEPQMFLIGIIFMYMLMEYRL